MVDADATVRLRRALPQIIVSVWIPLCFIFASINQKFLPARYFADSYYIQGLEQIATDPSPDSFVTTAWFYRIIGGFEYPAITQLGTLAIFFATVFCCASWLDVSRFGALEVVLFCFCGAEAAIYLAQFSKESIVVLIVLALVVMPQGALGDILFLALVCGYAYMMRSYWFIVAGLYLALRLLLHLRKPSTFPIFAIIAMLCIALGADVIFGLDIHNTRDVVAQTNSLYAQTVIHDYIPATGPIGGALNALCTLILLVIPLPLIVTADPVYLTFAALMTVLWINLFSVIRDGMRRAWFATDVSLARAVSLLLAMLTVQAIFEPDYGSYIKHLTPLLPLFFFPLRGRRQNKGATTPLETRQVF